MICEAGVWDKCDNIYSLKGVKVMFSSQVLEFLRIFMYFVVNPSFISLFISISFYPFAQGCGMILSEVGKTTCDALINGVYFQRNPMCP